MAAKVKISKLLQEIRGFAEITNRRPQPKPPGFFLMQLRSHLVHTTLPRPKRSISINIQNLPDIPHPVKITHVQDNPVVTATLPAP
jgi:hypothetical protein